MLKNWWARAVVGRTSVSDPFEEFDQPDAQFEAAWRPNVKARLLVILALLGAWAVGVEARLVYLQLIEHETFAAKARTQQQDIVELELPRGDVVDRDGRLLAYSVESFDVTANPSLIKDPVAMARELCAVLADCSADELAQITARLRRPKKHVVLRQARAMSPDAARRVREWNAARAEAKEPVVIDLEPKSRRYYPKLDLAAHVVGSVDGAGKGVGGLEFSYNSEISGTKGKLLRVVDGHTNEMFTRVESAPTPGATLELTIDVALQHLAEKELRAGILATGARSGTAIVLDSQTAEILAQTSYPTFNPNVAGDPNDEGRRNRAVQDMYEPGSTFKLVTGSAVLNEGLLTPSTLIDTRPGYITFPGRTIYEDKRHNYGVLSFEDVVIRSSNVGAIKAGLMVGVERMLKYVRDFGFGQSIAPDFRGEAIGIVHPASRTNNSGLASISMGYQISVTPMQMAVATNVIATGGLLIEPRVVRAVIRDGRRQAVEPKVLRRVIPPEIARTMTVIMEGVVERGTGSRAALERYRVAGKTGTSEKAIPGGYSNTDFNVSFAGFVPSDRPAFTILVMVDSPQIGPRYGGSVAAPIFKRIAEGALQLAGVQPSINPAPPVVVASNAVAPTVEPTSTSALAPTLTDAAGRPIMPDLRGLSLRDALRAAAALGLPITADGDGVVVFQTPAVGTSLSPSHRGVLQLRRMPLKSGGSDR